MTVPTICTVWHPDVTADMISPLVKGKVIEIKATTEEEALRQLPNDIHIFRPKSINAGKNPIILLRSSRAVMEVLRTDGWHSGHWRDDVSGQDNGVRRLFASTQDKVVRIAGLHDIIHTLNEESRQIPNGVATLWHDEITLDMLKCEGFHAIEIVASNANEAKATFKKILNNGKK